MAKASSRVGVTVSDTKTTERLLANMPLELREKQLKQAVRKAGNVVVQEARRRLPASKYGGKENRKMNLRQSIAVKVKTYGPRVAGFVGPRRPWGNHAHFIEYGFEQHWVMLRSGVKVLRGSPREHFVNAKGKWNTASPKQVQRRPFMRPAAISTQKQQEQAFINHLRKGIGELARH